MSGQTVYADLTFMTNLGADFLLLYFTAVLSGSRIRWWRLLAAAGTGAVFALLFVLYPDSLWLSPLPRLLFALLMVYIAFAPITGKAFLRATGFFYLLSFLVGGAAYALAGLGFAPLSFQALPWALLVACLLTVVAHRWLTQKTLASRQFCRVEVQQEDCMIAGVGFIDTGNALCDPLSGRPAIIADYRWLSPILPTELRELVEAGEWNTIRGAEVLAGSPYASCCRLLPFQSLGQPGGLLLGITCAQVKIQYRQETHLHNQALVAIAREGLSQEDSFQALIPAALV